MRAALFAFALILTGVANAAPAAPLADAQRWLALVDAGDYAASWSAAATLFQQRVTEAQWEKAVGAVREPLGAVVTRALLKEKQTKSLPGAPDGAYDIIQFSTRFASKKAAVETVVLSHETSGWRVSGYFVK